MRNRRIGWWRVGALTMVLPALAVSQMATRTLTLTVDGQSTELPVTRMNGHSYVDVDALARTTGGSITFQGKHMVLTLPGSGTAAGNPASSAANGSAAAPAAGAAASSVANDPAAAAAAPVALSKDFLRSAIDTMAAIRDWRSALTTGVQNGTPIKDLGLANFRATAAQNLRQTSVSVTTEADKLALALVTSEFGNMRALSDKFLASAQSMTYVAPDSVTSDPLDLKIVACARSLAAMSTTGIYVDDGTCH